MSSQNKLAETSDLLLQVLLYAQKNKIDLNNKVEIKKIIKFLNLPIAHEELDQFIKLVQDTETFVDLLESKRNNKNKKITN